MSRLSFTYPEMCKGGPCATVPTNGSWGHRFWVSPGRPRQMSFEKFIFSPLCSFGVEMCHGALTHPKTQTPQGVGRKCPCHPEGCTFPLKKTAAVCQCQNCRMHFPPPGFSTQDHSQRLDCAEQSFTQQQSQSSNRNPPGVCLRSPTTATGPLLGRGGRLVEGGHLRGGWPAASDAEAAGGAASGAEDGAGHCAADWGEGTGKQSPTPSHCVHSCDQPCEPVLCALAHGFGCSGAAVLFAPRISLPMTLS